MKPEVGVPLASLAARCSVLESQTATLQRQLAILLPQLSGTINSAIVSVSGTFANRELSLFNVREFGALGDNVTDDYTAIQSASNAAALTTNGVYGGMVYLPKGTYRISKGITLPEGVGIIGANPASTIVRALPTFNDVSMVRNAAQTGQEFCFVEGLEFDGNAGAGAICSTAVVDLTSVFINSYVRDCIIAGGSNVGLHIGATNAAGPVLVENVWSLAHNGDSILIDEATTNGASVQGVILMNVAAERQGNGKAAIRLSGSAGHCSGWALYNTHIEMTATGSNTTGLVVDNVAYVIIDDIQIQATSGPGFCTGVLITNTPQNLGIQLRNVTNINGINPVILDQKSGQTLGALNVPFYATTDVGIFPVGVQTLTPTSPISGSCANGDYMEILLATTGSFTIANPSSARVGQTLTYGIFNFSGGTVSINWGSEFSFKDSSFAAPANGKGRTIVWRRRTSNSWIQVGAATGDM